jgi:hypothetical protein
MSYIYFSGFFTFTRWIWTSVELFVFTFSFPLPLKIDDESSHAFLVVEHWVSTWCVLVMYNLAWYPCVFPTYACIDTKLIILECMYYLIIVLVIGDTIYESSKKQTRVREPFLCFFPTSVHEYKCMWKLICISKTRGIHSVNEIIHVDVCHQGFHTCVNKSSWISSAPWNTWEGTPRSICISNFFIQSCFHIIYKQLVKHCQSSQ